MNEYEKSLIRKTNEQLGEQELRRITRLTADIKRAYELFALLPEAEEEFRSNPEDFIKRYNLTVSADDITYCVLKENLKKRIEDMSSPDVLDRIPECLFRYNQYLGNLVAGRNHIRDKMCVPTDPVVKKWRQRQYNRCTGAIGGANQVFIHCPVAYEMADGCSVGCDFCGLGAGRLKNIFRYNEENASLFRGVLNVLKERFGIAAGMGMMYFASEALDNPDYELFEEEYYRIFNYIPQITTAVATRDIERTRRLVHELDSKTGYIHRFTLLDLEMTREVFDSFSSEELLRVELIPQYPEAPAFTPYVVVGNEAKRDENLDKADVADNGTISCVDGFCVNFSKKTIRIFTPCRMSERYPNGIAVVEETGFEDVEEFSEKLDYLINKYMKNDIPEDNLLLYEYFSIRDTEGGRAIVSSHGGETVLLDRLPEFGERTISLLMDGTHNRHEIVEAIRTEYEARPEEIFWLLNQLWNKGFIVEKAFFDK